MVPWLLRTVWFITKGCASHFTLSNSYPLYALCHAVQQWGLNIHPQTYIHKHTYTDTYTQTYIHKHTHTNTHTYTHTQTHIHTYTNIHTQTYIYKHTNTNIHVHIQKHTLLLHGPGDAVARISSSSMVVLHTLLSRVKCVASCNVIFSSLQSSFIILIHRSSPIPDSMNIPVACYLGISSILHPGQISKVAQWLVLYSVNYAASDV